ncbi:Na+/H+ antiporter subunit G [Corynebacterium uterequi]|uniref:Multisubunit Na+/H+ antiporter, MnhG subunit n=1 Tax=Corynebacterium uterequi TaxID=1072256 RepID=A0A0G3HBW4_9CORY|nr:Na+/H+ antiporter subunit G [Corynebacterium uterequi]AKK10175.1 multisubunit Na+/H+ antiporter, MnhG subunit [Corynebacterium uterequi]
MTWYEIIVAALVVLAAAMALVTAIAQWRAPDALTRVNLMGPLVGVGLPVLIVAKLIYDWATRGFDPNDFVRAIIAIAGLWVIASVGSFYMGRAVYGVTVVDSTPEGAEREGDPERQRP